MITIRTNIIVILHAITNNLGRPRCITILKVADFFRYTSQRMCLCISPFEQYGLSLCLPLIYILAAKGYSNSIGLWRKEISETMIKQFHNTEHSKANVFKKFISLKRYHCNSYFIVKKVIYRTSVREEKDKIHT